MNMNTFWGLVVGKHFPYLISKVCLITKYKYQNCSCNLSFTDQNYNLLVRTYEVEPKSFRDSAAVGRASTLSLSVQDGLFVSSQKFVWNTLEFISASFNRRFGYSLFFKKVCSKIKVVESDGAPLRAMRESSIFCFLGFAPNRPKSFPQIYYW